MLFLINFFGVLMNKFLIGFIIGVIIAGGLSIFLNNSSLEFVKKNFNINNSPNNNDTLLLKPDIKIQEKKKDDNYDFYHILKTKIDNTKTSTNNKVNSKINYYVKIAAVHSIEDADNSKGQLALIGIDANIIKVDDNTYELLVGPFKDKNDAINVSNTLLNQNFQSTIINN